MVRIATAAVLAPALWVLIKLAPPSAFQLAVVVLIAVASWECYCMLEHRGGRPFKWLGLAAALAVVWSFAGRDPHFEVQLPLVLVAGLTVALAMWRRSEPSEMLGSSLNTLFPVLFIGLGLAYLVGLRSMPGEDGKDLLLLLFFCVILSDTAAYYIGGWLGRRPMAPRLSPNKSWEGAAAGLAASVGGGLIAHAWFYQRLPLEHAVALGLILGLAGIVGDLAESMIKRAADVKDSSRLLPGHGGVLDRTDSLLFAGPILYYYYRLFVQGAA